LCFHLQTSVTIEAFGSGLLCLNSNLPLQVSEPKLDRPLRLPVIFGRMIDGILQQLLDLILRDYVGVWCSEAGFKSDELIRDLK
jgi:hypothetical protein